MKLKISELFSLAAVATAIVYAAVTNPAPSELIQKGVINRKQIQEDSSVILIDLSVHTPITVLSSF